jgi:hypothetical protein
MPDILPLLPMMSEESVVFHKPKSHQRYAIPSIKAMVEEHIVPVTSHKIAYGIASNFRKCKIVKTMRVNP